MAEEDKEAEVVEKEPGTPKKKLIMIASVAAIIIIATILFFTGVFDSAKESDELAEGQSGDLAEQSDNASEADDAGSVSSGEPVIYETLMPAFKVNFPHSTVNILKISVSIMTKSQDVIDAVKMHDPLIRNNVLLLLSSQDPEVLKLTAGKLELQSVIKQDINKVLAANGIRENVIEVFFTEMVMQ